MVATIPRCQFNNESGFYSCLIWTLSDLLTRLELLWKLVCQVEMRSLRCYGWLLVYLTKQCFPNSHRQDTRDIFKYKFISQYKNLTKNFPSVSTIGQLLDDIDHVLYIDLDDGFE